MCIEKKDIGEDDSLQDAQETETSYSLVIIFLPPPHTYLLFRFTLIGRNAVSVKAITNYVLVLITVSNVRSRMHRTRI